VLPFNWRSCGRTCPSALTAVPFPREPTELREELQEGRAVPRRTLGFFWNLVNWMEKSQQQSQNIQTVFYHSVVLALLMYCCAVCPH